MSDSIEIDGEVTDRYKTSRPTMELRWYVASPVTPPILQQAFEIREYIGHTCIGGGIDWRDVPEEHYKA